LTGIKLPANDRFAITTVLRNQNFYYGVLAVAPTLFFSVATNKFLTVFNIETVILEISLLLFFALGPTLALIIGSFDLSNISVIVLCTMVIALLFPAIGPLAVLVAFGIGVAAGLINSIVLTRLKINSFLATLASQLTILAIAGYTVYGRYPSIEFTAFEFLLRPMIPGVPTLFLWAAATYGLFYYVLKHTRFGWSLYAVGSSTQGARLVGIDITKTQVIIFVISGAIGALASIFVISYYGYASIDIVDLDSLFISYAVIVMGGTSLAGGTGGVHRNFLGAYIIAIIDNGMKLLGAELAPLMIFEGLAIILATMAMLRHARVILA
jgi:ribose transport system permease protein